MINGLAYGTVVWKVLNATADGFDADTEPDLVGVNGVVRFTPSVSKWTVVGDGSAPVTLLGVAVTGNIVNGVLFDAMGQTGVTLVADNGATNPAGWTWTAAYTIGNVSGSITFSLAAGEVVDLTTKTPVGVSNGVLITQGPKGDKGDPGPQGIQGPAGNGAADASATVKGVVQLAGDLGGTAAAPTVPGLANKAPISNPTFTGTVSGVTKSMVGLANVDNTSDANKPVSSAQQTALNTKASVSGGVTAIQQITAAAYAALGTKVATTLYVIVG